MFSRQGPTTTNTMGFNSASQVSGALRQPVVLNELNKTTIPSLTYQLFKYPIPVRTALPVNDAELEGYKKNLRAEGITPKGIIPQMGQHFVDDSYFAKIAELRKNAAFEDFQMWQVNEAAKLMNKGPVARQWIAQKFPSLMEGVKGYNQMRRDFQARLEDISTFGMKTQGDYNLVYEMSIDPMTFNKFLNPSLQFKSTGPELNKLIQIWRHIQLVDQTSEMPVPDPILSLSAGIKDEGAIATNLTKDRDMTEIAASNTSDLGKHVETMQEPSVAQNQTTLDNGQRKDLNLPGSVEPLPQTDTGTASNILEPKKPEVGQPQ